ncbi:carbohydrate ABC transporter permease [Acetanaerobacterium elongatum]|uniref:Carbohydrate ABC transporter membrane protein 1, CUT1 family n=1 Tax=Acetanaerobacterium elongatum TaxID=258515 RepID=A0A1G9WAU3_9FIRM|nr:sugar ABC transporter permease [Acetanaerobacterium elongatum]SDM81579.1 carbohydrate ABC transporter membrane protein 1, CUT1 family [Acetanaerobacterium elongatum]
MRNSTAYLFLAPSLVGLCIFVLFPFGDMVRRSFFNTIGSRFTGLENYTSVVTNTAFQQAVTNTARFISVCIPLLLLISLVLALLVRFIRPHGKVFKTSFLIPMAVPVASIVLLWQALFHKMGIINNILACMGGTPIDFMETDAAFWVLIITYLWKNSGYTMILLLAGLDGIPSQMYEAAGVDGAGTLQKYRFITLPELFPTLLLTAVLSLLNSFKVFREAYLVAGSYPHKSIYLLQHLFNNWFLDLDLGRLSAAAVLVAAALLGLMIVLWRMWKGEDAL